VSDEAAPPPAGRSGTAALEPWLREILRCPRCRAALRDEAGPQGPELVCANPDCGLAYRVDDGIPVMLVDEARPTKGPTTGPGNGPTDGPTSQPANRPAEA
jgi:uncharacterized protein